MTRRKSCLLLVLFVFQSLVLDAQTIGFSEGLWAFLHPFAAIRIKKITKHCDKIYNTSLQRPELDPYSSGGKRDAYRHVFYMAAFSQKVKPSKVRKLGIAHEKTNYRQFRSGQLEQGELPDSLSSRMDLLNNELGCKIGERYSDSELEQLNELVIKTIVAGEAYILKRNKSGQYLNCAGKPISSSNNKSWETDKCLVPSNDNYID